MFTKSNTRGGKMNGCGSMAGKMGKRNRGIFREDIGLQTCGNNTAGVRDDIGLQTCGNNTAGVREDIGLQTCGNNTAGVNQMRKRNRAIFQPNAQVAFENIRKRLKQAENIRKLAPFV